MGLQRGFNAAAGMKNVSRGGNQNAHQHFMRDGQVTLARFWGSFETQEAPVYSKKHFIKRLNGADAHMQCGDNSDSHCVPCYFKERKDKGISLSAVANFFIKDYAKYHKLEAEVKALKPTFIPGPGRVATAEDYEMTQYPTCLLTRTRQCPYCQQGNEAKDRGFKWFALSEGHATPLINKAAELRDYCRCGGIDNSGDVPGPTLSVVSHYCPECSEDFDFYAPEQGVVVCKHCHETVAPLELLNCSNEDCPGPERCDVQDYMFRIRRIGASTDTTYAFDPIFPCRPPTKEELDLYEKVKPNWEELLAPLPPEVQAQKLNVPNPFPPSGGHGAVSYQAAAASTGEAEHAVPAKLGFKFKRS
jgi:hypothetical protein